MEKKREGKKSHPETKRGGISQDGGFRQGEMRKEGEKEFKKRGKKKGPECEIQRARGALFSSHEEHWLKTGKEEIGPRKLLAN